MSGNHVAQTDPMTPGRRSRWIATPLALAAMLAALAGVLALQTGPRGDGPVAAIFPPWWDADRTLAAAAAGGDAIVRGGGFGNVVVVSPDRPGLAGRLRGSGAWAIIDPQIVGGCSIASSERERR